MFKNSLKKHLEKGRCDVLKQQKRIKLIKTDNEEVNYDSTIKMMDDSDSNLFGNSDIDLLSVC